MIGRVFPALLILCCICQSLFGDTTLKEHLNSAQSGDYIVTLQNRAYTLIHIQAKNADTLVIEEITVSQQRRDKAKDSWTDWVRNGAPHHSSWVLYELALKNASMLEAYSVSAKAWLNLAPEENFLSSLLSLEMQAVPDEQRRRMGPPPQPGQADLRSIWNPRLVSQSKVIKGVPFDAWRATWPKDGSELSGKSVIAYLPSVAGDYPSYFPYWLELGGGLGRAQLRIVDSGIGMSSPAPTLPKRPPEFLDSGRLSGDELSFEVKGRPYFKDYRLLALNADQPNTAPLPLEFSSSSPSNGHLTITVSLEAQRERLSSAYRYYFIFSPVGHEHLYARTREPLRPLDSHE